MSVLRESISRQDKYLPIDNEFDVEFANAIAKSESYNKHLYRPNTYLHKWWARRCGTTFRLILKHLVDNPLKRNYYAPGGLEGKIILDPMMGGGTTLHEAIRMGANVIGADIDPIPVLQARATLTDIPLEDLETAFNEFYRNLRADLLSFFLTRCPCCSQTSEIQFTLYGLKRYCGCGQVIFIDSYILRRESNGTTISICPWCHQISYNGEHSHNCQQEGIDNHLLIEKGTKSCSVCRKPYTEDLRTVFVDRYVPLVIVGYCQEHGLFFKSPDTDDLNRIRVANETGRSIFFGNDFDICPGPKSEDLIKRGVKSYVELFSGRQLLYIHQAIQLLENYDPLIRLNLALLVSTSLEFNSMLCGYKGGEVNRPGAIRHVFAHHAYSIPYTVLENNPIFPDKTSGTLQNLFHSRILRGRQWAVKPKERKIEKDKIHTVIIEGERDVGTEVTKQEELEQGRSRFLLIEGSSVSLNLKSNSVDYVVTDPPYFDNVQYGDLAAFFRVWLKKLIPEDHQWDYDLNKSAVDPQTNGNGQYTEVLSGIFSECYRVLRKDRGRLIFTFHHWNPKAWAALTIALKQAGFKLVNRYVVQAENPTSVHINGLKSLRHDAVLVLAPKDLDIFRFWMLPQNLFKTNDSYQFCEDCATVLGWLLQSEIRLEKVEEYWQRFMGKSCSAL